MHIFCRIKMEHVLTAHCFQEKKRRDIFVLDDESQNNPENLLSYANVTCDRYSCYANIQTQHGSASKYDDTDKT